MDNIQAKQDEGRIGALNFIEPFRLGRKPSEYWSTNCWVGTSFMTRDDALDRALIGVDRIMWGSDFPHEEGTFPFTREALANTYSGMDPEEVAKMIGANAAGVYGFDLGQLEPLAAEIGPEVEQVARGIDQVPDSISLAFEPRPGDCVVTIAFRGVQKLGWQTAAGSASDRSNPFPSSHRQGGTISSARASPWSSERGPSAAP